MDADTRTYLHMGFRPRSHAWPRAAWVCHMVSVNIYLPSFLGIISHLVVLVGAPARSNMFGIYPTFLPSPLNAVPYLPHCPHRAGGAGEGEVEGEGEGAEVHDIPTAPYRNIYLIPTYLISNFSVYLSCHLYVYTHPTPSHALPPPLSYSFSSLFPRLYCCCLLLPYFFSFLALLRHRQSLLQKALVIVVELYSSVR